MVIAITLTHTHTQRFQEEGKSRFGQCHLSTIPSLTIARKGSWAKEKKKKSQQSCIIKSHSLDTSGWLFNPSKRVREGGKHGERGRKREREKRLEVVNRGQLDEDKPESPRPKSPIGLVSSTFKAQDAILDAIVRFDSQHTDIGTLYTHTHTDTPILEGGQKSWPAGSLT